MLLASRRDGCVFNLSMLTDLEFYKNYAAKARLVKYLWNAIPGAKLRKKNNIEANLEILLGNPSEANQKKERTLF